MDNAQVLAALFGSDDDETGDDHAVEDIWDSTDESPSIHVEARLVEAAERIEKGEAIKMVCRELSVSRNTVNTLAHTTHIKHCVVFVKSAVQNAVP